MKFFLLIALICMMLAGRTRAATEPTLLAEPDRVELTVAAQRVLFKRSQQGFVLTTSVREDDNWRPMFDAGRPLLQGPLFDLHPATYTVLTNTPGLKTIEFSGRHRSPDYPWSLRVEASTNSPLLHFTVTCRLPQPLTLSAPQPVVALWMLSPSPEFHLDQGPDSIYGSAGIPHNFGFPAAYLWHAGREAAVFFNMTPMRWMQPDGVARFHDVRIMSRSVSSQTGLGMHFKKLTGQRIPAGDMIISFHLHQQPRPVKPTGLQVLDTMITAFAHLHPGTSVLPTNQLTSKTARWEQLARQAIQDLMSGPQLMAELPAEWHDEPLPLVPSQKTMLVHSGNVASQTNQVCTHWDFSTVNNHLTPWLLLSRLYGNTQALQIALQKTDALPRFYDPRSRLIRHGTRQPPHVGDLEMTWQNLFFHQETLRAAGANPPAHFNPAIAGRFLMATAGLRELATNTAYIFPQWFNPYTKEPAIQNDVQKLGKVREPWQAGAYAHLMLQAFQLTGEVDFQNEAQRAVETLMERMQFRVQNEVYDRHYSNIAEFPITELFGNAWGIAAASELYQITGNPKFLRYSRDFLNTLLRLTFWYEDETSPLNRELRNLGLFYPHGGAHVATPWETAEAHLMLVWTLKHDLHHPLTNLLLNLSNLNRINSFYFFPATWTPPVRALDEKNLHALGQYFPIEPFHCLEGAGHRGKTAAYMASLAMWNAWLYEALAQADDSEIMVLNLDATENYQSALTALERNFIIYNPGSSTRSTRIRFKHLPDSAYTLASGQQETKHSASELKQGLPITLDASQHLRLTLRALNYSQQQQELKQQQTAQNALSHAYQLLQQNASRAKDQTQPFAKALQAFQSAHYLRAHVLATELVQTIKTSHKEPKP